MRGKNVFKLLIISLVILVFPKNVFALSANTSCSASGSVNLGNTVTVTISGNASESVLWDVLMGYDSSKLQYISGAGEHFISNDFSSNVSISYTFKTIGLGSASVRVSSAQVANQSGTEVGASGSSCNINIVQPAPVKPKNSDNNLKSLSVEGTAISPEFNKDTLEYNAELPADTTKAKISAEVNNSLARVSGIGDVDVVEGENKIDIVVTAENGSTKTYVLKINVLEKEPINVTVNGKQFSVLRKKDILKIPEGYAEDIVKINGEDIPACKNDITGYRLVGLKDENGKASWYIYDTQNLSYSKYIELTSKSLRLIALEAKKKDVPAAFYECMFTYEDQEIKGYAFDETSDFRLIYALDITSGDRNFYMYDMKNKTLQKFYNAESEILIKTIEKYKILLLIMVCALAVLFLSIIISTARNISFKKKYLNRFETPIVEEVPTEEVTYKDIDETQTYDNIDESIEKQKRKKEKTFIDE